MVLVSTLVSRISDFNSPTTVQSVQYIALYLQYDIAAALDH